MLAAALAVALVALATGTALAGDPTGAATGPAGAAGHNSIAITFVWLFLGGALVFFMQAGFAALETGLCQKKNAMHVMMTNFIIFGLGAIAFYFVGFPIMFGGVGALTNLGGAPILTRELAIGGWGLAGWKGFGLGGPAYDVGIYLFFLFQVAFMDTAATIPTGALAERWKFSAFCLYGVFMAAVAYPLFGNWVWGGGWLSQLGSKAGLGNGFVDFAGSSVVHALGGLAGLAGAFVIGPRFGKFGRDGTPRAMPGHNITLAITGTIILVFGWLGFNASSTMNGGDLRLGVIATNTLLAASFGAVSAMLYMWKTTGYPDPSMSANGCLAGLVAVTAPCAFIGGWAAALIGTVAGVLVCLAVFTIERRMGIDDPVGAVAVHGVNGLWGIIAVGIFADGTYGAGWNGVAGAVRGALYGAWSQLLAQVIGAVACAVFALGLFYLFFKVQDRLMGIRISPEAEIEGADLEVGVPAYTEESHVYSEAGI